MPQNQTIYFQSLSLCREDRSSIKHQRPVVVWLTGLSGAGKSTIADALERLLLQERRHTFILDGDNIRLGLSRDLGFSVSDRNENVRRVAEVARLMTDAGLIVIMAFISPLMAERELARQILSDVAFIEVFVDAPLEVCIDRDPKGLYERALAGEIKNFTGIDSPYEVPASPDLRLDTTTSSPDELALIVFDHIESLQPKAEPQLQLVGA